MKPGDVYIGQRVIVRADPDILRAGEAATVIARVREKRGARRNCWHVRFADGDERIFNAYWLEAAPGSAVH